MCYSVSCIKTREIIAVIIFTTLNYEYNKFRENL